MYVQHYMQYYMQRLYANGTVQCEKDAVNLMNLGNGFVTTNTSSTGNMMLAIDYDVVQRRVSSTCAHGSSLRAIYSDGTIDCELDNDSGGDITSVNVTNGLIGGGQVGDITLSINTSFLQKRILQSCSLGSYIREINEDGSVTCTAERSTNVTSISSGHGIDRSGASSPGSVTLAVNTFEIQNRFSLSYENFHNEQKINKNYSSVNK